MEELKQRFPFDVDYDVGYDTTPFIRESIEDVVTTLLEAVALVGVVVLLFLQDWRAMILPMIDVPVSIIGTFTVMAMLGFSLNNISLFGLVLAIGIVVDDAIVVLENIERMMARGHDPRTATLMAMDEVTGPIIAVGLVLCAVFVPCAFLSGITGRFFYQFAVTISVSTMISALNAVTMTPSRAVQIFTSQARHGEGNHSSKEALPWWIFGVPGGLLSIWLARRFLAGLFPGLRVEWSVDLLAAFIPGALLGAGVGWFVIRPVNAVLGWCFRGFNAGFEWITGGYGWTIGKALHHSPTVLLLYGVLVGLTFFVFTRAPTGFIPGQDMGRLFSEHPDARFGVARANARRRRAGRENHSRGAGCLPHGQHLRPIVPHAGQQSKLRLDVRRPQAVRRTARPGAHRQSHHGKVAARVAPADTGCRGHCSSGGAAAGRRRCRRLQILGRGSGQSGADGLAGPDGHPYPESARAAGIALRPRNSAPTRRNSSWTSIGPRSLRSAWRSTTSISRSTSTWARSTSIASTSSAGTGRSTFRQIVRFAIRSRTCT